jgi:NADPH2:quinone reductase
MKAMIIKEPGVAESFVFEEVQLPKLRPGHILVKVRATSVNPIDTKVRGKQLPFSPQYPAILHVDFSGEVAEVPVDVNHFKVGDSVYGVAGGIKGTVGGALAEYQLVDANMVAHKPANLSFAEAAALPLVSITAWEALVDKLNVSAGESLLVQGGLGGVGHIAAQLGRSIGAVVHTTVSKDEDKQESKKFGADHVINYKTSTVQDYVDTYTGGKGFDFIFDTVGGPNLQKSFEGTKLNGSIACIATGGNHDLTLMYARGLSLHSVLMLIPLMTGVGRDHYGQILAEITKLVEKGEIKPLIDGRIFNWKDISEAHKLVESGLQKGKVVVLVE